MKNKSNSIPPNGAGFRPVESQARAGLRSRTPAVSSRRRTSLTHQDDIEGRYSIGGGNGAILDAIDARQRPAGPSSHPTWTGTTGSCSRRAACPPCSTTTCAGTCIVPARSSCMRTARWTARSSPPRRPARSSRPSMSRQRRRARAGAGLLARPTGHRSPRDGLGRRSSWTRNLRRARRECPPE